MIQSRTNNTAFSLTRFVLKCLVICFTLGASVFAVAQTTTLNGSLSDGDTSEPLAFATISTEIDGKTMGTQTDLDGNFSLTIPSEAIRNEPVLIFQYLGYEIKEYTLSPNFDPAGKLNISLLPAANVFDELVVTGSKFEKPLSEVTVSMEVLKPGLINSVNSTQIDQGLKKVPGVTIIDGQANIRGGSGFSYGAGSRVLLMMDGVPFQQADAGFPNWDFVPIENIKQVEVIKGASSALYGSSALNGIVNIRTAYATDKPYTSFNLFSTIYETPSDVDDVWFEGSPPNEQGFSFAHRSRLSKKVDLVAGAYIFRQDSWRKTEEKRRVRGNVNLTYRATDKLTLGLNSNLQFSDNSSVLIWSGLDNGMYEPWVTGDSEVTTATRSTKFSLDPSIRLQLPKNQVLKFIGRLYSTDNRATNNQSNTAKNYYGELQYRVSLREFAQITAGVVSNLTKAEADLFGNASYTGKNYALFAQAENKFFDKFTLSAGLRYENFELTDSLATDSEDKLVGRFGMNYQLKEHTFFRGSFGQGFRFPTIAEKYITTNLGSFGVFANPEITSETGWSAELGIKQGLQLNDWKGYLDISAFVNRYYDMTEFTFGLQTGGIGFRAENVGDTDIRGFEVSLAGKGKLGNWPVQTLLGYTYIDPRFQDFTEEVERASSSDQNILKYRFRHTAKADVETFINNGPLSVGLALNYNSFMEAIDVFFVEVFPGLEKWREDNNSGNAILDFRTAYRFSEKVSLNFIVKNVFNRTYTIRPALIEAPRNFTLKFSYQL